MQNFDLISGRRNFRVDSETINDDTSSWHKWQAPASTREHVINTLVQESERLRTLAMGACTRQLMHVYREQQIASMAHRKAADFLQAEHEDFDESDQELLSLCNHTLAGFIDAFENSCDDHDMRRRMAVLMERWEAHGKNCDALNDTGEEPKPEQ